MSSLLTSDALEHQPGVDVCTGDKRIAADDGHVEGDQDEPDQFTCRLVALPASPSVPGFLRYLSERHQDSVRWDNLLQNLHKKWDAALDELYDTWMPKENYSLHCSVGEPDPSFRFPTRDVVYNNMPFSTDMKIFQDDISALADLQSSLVQCKIIRDIKPANIVLDENMVAMVQCNIIHGDLKPDNILLDENMVAKISDFGMSRGLHADAYTHIPIGRAVLPHIGLHGIKFLEKTSGKHGIEIKIGSHMRLVRRYFSVHHHPLIQILPPARKWSGDILTSCVRLISPFKFLGIAEAGWISAKPKYETPDAGTISGYISRKYFNIRKWLNESQQYSNPDTSRPDHGKMEVNTMTSVSWIIATAAPHHATGDRNLLSGFVMEHDDLFVHAVNRVPMKVLARGAVVTDTLILPDVWFVPGLTENLVSVSQLAELDHSIGFGRGECCISSARDANVVGKGRLQKGGHYVLDYLKVPLAI